MVHNMAGFFKLPPQEFAAKLGMMTACVVQPLAMVLLFILAIKEDGAVINQVFQVFFYLSGASVGTGIVASGVHAVTSALVARWGAQTAIAQARTAEAQNGGASA